MSIYEKQQWRGIVMKQAIGSRMLMLLVFVSLLSLLGCGDDLVTIHYGQPANAYVFDKDPFNGQPHTTLSAQDGMFAFYCINAIENDDANAVDFKLDLKKIYALNNRDDNPGGNSVSDLAQTAPNMATVPAHSTSPALGRIVIRVSGVLDPNHLDEMYNLSYNSEGQESVLLVREGGDNPPPVQFLDPAHPGNLPACP